MFLANSESPFILAFGKYKLYSKLYFHFYFLVAENPCLVTQIVQNFLLFVYLFCPKTTQLIQEKFHYSGKIGRRKLPDHSLNRIFNALSIDTQYTLCFK